MSNKDRNQRKATNGFAHDSEDLIMNPNAVSSLTKKIEVNLKNTQSERLPQGQKGQGSARGQNGGREKMVQSSRLIDGQSPEAAQTKMNGILHSKPQGKKRLRDGRLKESAHTLPRPNGIQQKQEGLKSNSEEHTRLEEEILALGGSKEDLKLIEDAESESELEAGTTTDEKPKSQSLKKELLQLVKELGIQQAFQDVDESPESDQDENRVADQAEEKRMTDAPRKVTDVTQAKNAKGGASEYQVEPIQDWHAVTLPVLNLPSAKTPAITPDLVARVHEYAKSLLDAENERYASQAGSANSAQQFYSTVMSSGTLSDKISALTLSVQESPLHNMRALESLLGLARKRSRGQAVEVLGALKDLFGTGSVLPPDRKLRTFATQPELSAVFMSQTKWKSNDPLPETLTRAHLILWAFEDWLKAMYFEILKILETWCNDEVVFARGKAVDYVCQLLKEKPEQEANLLRLLVNKLGDNDKKVASKTSYHILQLETAHPLMKPTIISAIESDLLFRPGQSLHAQYYAVITLNQTILSSKEESVARKLLDIYFSLFAKLLAKPQPAKLPLPEASQVKINHKGEVQGGGGPAGKAARRKAELKEKSTTVEEDLREKMLSAVLTGVNRAVPYANSTDAIFDKHMDTLFRVTHSSNFNTSVQALMLIQQLTGTHHGSVDRFYRTLYESLLDSRLLTSSKQALYLNLLFKSLRSDLSIKRVKAFAKRLLQVVSMHQPAFACGAMYMLRELESSFANLAASVDDREEDESDEEEVFQDVQETEIDPPPPAQSNGLNPPKPKKYPYDGRKRDPEHSNADRACLWEILPFQTHYHPSVSLFAQKLLTHAPMPPKPDLQSHTLIHFLDRFVYRNPKTTTPARGASIMQPLPPSSFSSTSNKLLLPTAPSFRGRSKQPVNSEAFWKQEISKVEADEVFFHKYFSAVGKGREKAKNRKERKKGKGVGGSDDDDAGEEEDEEEIWKALVGSRPEIDGDEEEDEEGFDDLDDVDMGSDVELDDDDGNADGDGDEEEGGRPLDVGADDEIPDFAGDDDDDDSLLASDDDVPSHLLDRAFERETEEVQKTAEEGGKGVEEATPTTQQGGSGKNGERKRKRMKLKQLPTFAAADEYAAILEGEEEDGGGG
ncbi:MAG: hypothetical protein LQ348_003910 [Seirophora lacunosa]|nr:MAG: hypothetical protein LQ348_003910 [Seirophora lacunosa]